MTVKEIVATWLKEHGYDGLYKQGSEPCGCGILCAVDDFMPCAGNVDDCKPGYIHTSKCMDCEDDCDEGDGAFCTAATKGMRMPKASDVWEKPTRNILDVFADAILEDHCYPCGKLDDCDMPCEKVSEVIVAMKKRTKGVKHA